MIKVNSRKENASLCCVKTEKYATRRDLTSLFAIVACLFVWFFLHNHILVAFVDGMREGWSFLPQVLLFQKPGLISNHKINFISGLMQLFDC